MCVCVLYNWGTLYKTHSFNSLIVGETRKCVTSVFAISDLSRLETEIGVSDGKSDANSVLSMAPFNLCYNGRRFRFESFER